MDRRDIAGRAGVTLSRADWMINEDYKQGDPRGAKGFDILVQSQPAGWQITGGGGSSVTNPFANPQRTDSLDAQGNTIVHFTGSDTIPQNNTTMRHVGIFGSGPKPTILQKAWTFDTVPTRVPVPKSNVAFGYDPDTSTLRISVQNTSPDTVVFSQVGYLVSSVERPISDLTRGVLPPEAFSPLTVLDNLYNPTDSASVVIPGISPTDFVVTYATVQFGGASYINNDYKDVGGEWAQVAVGANIVPEPCTALLLGAGWAIVAGRRRAIRRGAACQGLRELRPCGRSVASLIGTLLIVAMLQGSTWGNVFVLKDEGPGNGRCPRVKIKVPVAGGGTKEITVLIDTGDDYAKNAGFLVNSAAGNNQAANLGLAGGADGAAAGAGNAAGAPTKDDIPLPGALSFSTPPVVPNQQAATTPTMPNQANTMELPVGIDALLGSAWLKDYSYGCVPGPNGRYWYLAKTDQGNDGKNKARSLADFYAGDNFPVNPGGRPAGGSVKPVIPTPAKNPPLPTGTSAIDGGVNLDISLSAGSGTVTNSFIIKTGFERTLISEDVARTLGINIGGLPQVATDVNFGTVDVGVANISLDIFQDGVFPVQSVTVGVLPDSLNPFKESFLGCNVLNRFAYWDVSWKDDLSGQDFFALVPEPASLATALVACAVLLGRKAKRR